MYDDALNDEDYSILLLTGDTDQVPTINWIRRLNKNIEILSLFPSFRASKELRGLSDRNWTIRKHTAAGHQFPDVVEYKEDGKMFIVRKPDLWK